MKSIAGRHISLLWGIILWGFFPLIAAAQDAPFPPAPELMGVRPGQTTLADLRQNPAFGEVQAKSQLGGYDVYTFKIPDMPDIPFVQLLIKDGRVDVVVVNLKEPRLIDDARASFREITRDCKPILVQDTEGKFREVYPESAVSFVFKKNEEAPDKPSDEVTQIVMEPLKPDFFLVRADENRRKLFAGGSIDAILADAESALRLDPQNGSAYWLLGTCEFLLENYSDALKYVSRAIQINDRVPEYHFLMMSILERTNSIDNGLRYWEAVQQICKTNPFHAAELSVLHGQLLLKKSDADCDAAIEELQKAADSLKPILTEGRSDREKLQALELSARLYSALGSAVAAKNWTQPKEREKAFLWFNASKTVLDTAQKRDASAMILLLDLWRNASEAALAAPEETQIDGFLAGVAEKLEGVLQQNIGVLEKEMIRVKAGETFFNAFLAADTRGDAETAEADALKAYAFLEPYLQSPSNRIMQIIGPVDYELGIYFNDHQTHQDLAETLLARAGDSISESLTLDGSALDADQGIRLVNIGKAYWYANNRQKGLELTQRGVAAIEKAVAAGNFPKEEYRVPCQNLITIYEALGDTVNADLCSEKMNSLLEGGPQSH